MPLFKSLASLGSRVKNIVIFVTDSLRFDYYPKELENYGLVMKCIAQSIFTPVSMASIVTGLNPPRHMVKDFSSLLPSSIPSIFDLPLNTSYWGHMEYDALYKVFKHPPRIPLEKLNEPFIYIEKTDETHVPYDPVFKDKPDGYRKYIRVVRRDKKKLVNDYKKAVERAFRRFLDLLDVLKKRGILSRSLVFLLSDHGDIITEYGSFLFHHFPPVPENVYVPLAIIHPDIEQALVKDVVVRHVDILPTILQMLGLELPILTEGISIVDILSKGIEVYGFNWYKRVRFGITTLSVWDKDGNGVVVIDAPPHLRLISAIGDMVRYSHNLYPLKLHRKVNVYGRGIDNWKEIVEIFRSMPTYGIKDRMLLSPMNIKWVSVRPRIVLESRIRRIKESLKFAGNSRNRES